MEKGLGYTFTSDISLEDSDIATVAYQDNDLTILSDIRKMPASDSVKMDSINVMIYCRKGRAQFAVNGKPMEVREKELAILQSNIIVSNYMISPDFQCYIAVMSDRLLKSQLRTQTDIWNRALFVNNTHIVKLPEEAVVGGDMERFYELMLSYIVSPRRAFREEVIASLVRCLLLDICALIQEQMPEPATTSSHSQSEQLFNKFLSILTVESVKHQSVSAYAARLFVTPKYLSAVCKSVSGKTALQWIDEYTTNDIRYYLEETSLSVKEISNCLGFPNLSFFGKYVKQHFGCSPNAYRKQ